MGDRLELGQPVVQAGGAERKAGGSPASRPRASDRDNQQDPRAGQGQVNLAVPAPRLGKLPLRKVRS